jgi:hypothetical protein
MLKRIRYLTTTAMKFAIRSSSGKSTLPKGI